jgi:hypothetical protein
MVWSGRSVAYKLTGIGFSVGDRVKMVDGEAYMGCATEVDGNGKNIQGGREVVLGAGTSLDTASVALVFDLPATHARFCYMYRCVYMYMLVCMCVCVCVFVFVCVCIYVHIYVCMYIILKTEAPLCFSVFET